jgi:hypothetical protein
VRPFAQDDNFGDGGRKQATATATATADPCGMTNKRADNSRNKNKRVHNSRNKSIGLGGWIL